MTKTNKHVQTKLIKRPAALFFVLVVIIGSVTYYRILSKPTIPSATNPVVSAPSISKQIQKDPEPSPINAGNNSSNSDTDNLGKPLNSHAAVILGTKKYPQLPYYALTTVNDPLVSGSWYHSKIQTDRAWDVTTGSTTTVAVIDTGFALDHSDLSNKWATNSGEQGQTSVGGICWTGLAASKATNNCDDDQNGFVDDWRGWDFNSYDNDPQTGVDNPTGAGVSHGTMVSGIIGATANNSYGSAGIDWQAKIMPLQVLNDDGEGYTYDIVAAIAYAVENGAKVINMSLGGGTMDQALSDAVDFAVDQGVIVVAASGNCGASTTGNCAGLSTGGMTYPAKFANVISVGATTSADARAVYSSYGPELDMVAPGSSVGPLTAWSTEFQTDGYITSGSGTSFASPMVAGAAALVRSQLTSPTVSLVRNILLDSNDKIGDLSDRVRSDNYGFGQLNIHKATLLAKSIQNIPGNVGTTEIQSSQAPRGGITRSTTGNVASDEWILVVCRVEMTDVCTSTATEGGTKTEFIPLNFSKGASVYNMFIKGSSLTSGTNTIAVHGRNYASSLGTVTK